MNLNDVRIYLTNLGNNYATLNPRDNFVNLFKEDQVFDIQLSILQVRSGVYQYPCIRFSIYSYRTRENAIGLWLRERFVDYLLSKQTNLDEYGKIVHPAFDRSAKCEGHVLGIIVRGTENWQEENFHNFGVNVQTNIQNIYNILQGFFNKINGITNLDEEIGTYNSQNQVAYNSYIGGNNTNDQHNDVAVPRATNQGSTKETTIDNLPRNLIYFGAPGTGKSYNLNKALENFRENFERVTFYPTYSYAQFVGTYKPVMKSVSAGKEEISYEFVPGPFLRVLVQALKNQGANYCLVIEEINRANAAAVFGDVFQLLDRKSTGESTGESEYSIAASEDIKKYLINQVKDIKDIKDIQVETLSIPQNMYIWATMNSADQGVFPMDTAFKRRWSFEYIGIDDGVTDECECKGWVIEGPNINWNVFRKFVNGLLSSFDVNEDKLMGPYFVKADIKADNIDQISKKLFASKVLMYLWEDAARMIRKNIFGAEIKTYSQLVSKWKTDGIKIFVNSEKFKETTEGGVSVQSNDAS